MSKRDETKESLLQEDYLRQDDLDDAAKSLQDDQPPAQGASGHTKLLVSFIAMVFVGTGNKIFQKLMSGTLANYMFFGSNWTTFVYIPMCFGYIIPDIYGWFWKSNITPEERKIPMKAFAVMGGLDAIAGVMQSFATVKIAGPLLILLQQSAIPMSMVISYFTLKARYVFWQILGAVILIGGLAVVIVPKLTGQTMDADTLLLWGGIMILSCIPMTLSSVYKEKALGEQEIDVVYLNGWIAIWQFIIGVPVAILPSWYENSVNGKDFADLFPNFTDGFLCYFGDTSKSIPLTDDGPEATDCSMAPVYVNIYLLFNLTYNVLIIVILKFGSANILWMAMTVVVPIGNMSFALPFMPEPASVGWEDIVGLVIVMSGLIMYRFMDQIRSPLSFWRRAPAGSAKYVGLINPSTGLENVQPLMYTFEHQKDKLYRNLGEIRSTYFSRLGITVPVERMAVNNDEFEA